MHVPVLTAVIPLVLVGAVVSGTSIFLLAKQGDVKAVLEVNAYVLQCLFLRIVRCKQARVQSRVTCPRRVICLLTPTDISCCALAGRGVLCLGGGGCSDFSVVGVGFAGPDGI